MTIIKQNTENAGYLHKHDRYLSEDTEVLTTTGWMNIRDVTYGTLVAQYWPHGEIEFVKPINITSKTVGSVFKYTSTAGTLSMVVSEDYVLSVDKFDSFSYTVAAKDYNTYSDINFVNSGHRKHPSGYGLSYVDLIKLAMNYIINTPECNLKAKGKSASFTLTDPKQIEAMVRILDLGAIKYKKWSRLFSGGTDFTIKDVDSTGIGLYENRYLKDWINFEDFTYYWFSSFLKEIVYWGGIKIKNHPDYFHYKSHSLDNHDLATVQAVAAMFSTTTVVKKRNGNIYGIDFLRNHLTKGTTVIKEHIVKPTHVVEVETKLGTLVIRHDGIVSITSNIESRVL